jgi:hypothetical protein
MAAIDITIAATARTIKLNTGLFIDNAFVASVDSQDTIACVSSALCAAPPTASAQMHQPRD